MKYANESQEFELAEIGENSRVNFIENLGELLSQTRERIEKCTYATEYEDWKGEFVLIHYKGGYIKPVNINLDSYTAIISDVVKAINS